MNKYREGKVKRTPVRGVKQNLKPYAYKQLELNSCSKEVENKEQQAKSDAVYNKIHKSV